MVQDKSILITQAINKSREALCSAEENYINHRYETCQNRLYYAIFYIVSALAYKEDFITSKHARLMGWFNKKYINEDKIFDNKFFAIYKEAFTNRQLSDYDFMYQPNPDEIFIMIKDVKDFLLTVEKYLQSTSGS